MSQSSGTDQCIVCNEATSTNNHNKLLQCNQCHVNVHQVCYGVNSDQLNDSAWLCYVCNNNDQCSTLKCVLCPNIGVDAYKLVHAKQNNSSKHQYCHVMCAMYIPELQYTLLQSSINNIDSIIKQRYESICNICHIKYGCTIQCANDKCKVMFHVTCARNLKSYVLHQEYIDTYTSTLNAYCNKHSDTVKHHSNHTLQIDNHTLNCIKQLPQNSDSEGDIVAVDDDSVRDTNESPMTISLHHRANSNDSTTSNTHELNKYAKSTRLHNSGMTDDSSVIDQRHKYNISRPTSHSSQSDLHDDAYDVAQQMITRQKFIGVINDYYKPLSKHEFYRLNCFQPIRLRSDTNYISKTPQTIHDIQHACYINNDYVEHNNNINNAAYSIIKHIPTSTYTKRPSTLPDTYAYNQLTRSISHTQHKSLLDRSYEVPPLGVPIADIDEYIAANRVHIPSYCEHDGVAYTTGCTISTDKPSSISVWCNNTQQHKYGCMLYNVDSDNKYIDLQTYHEVILDTPSAVDEVQYSVQQLNDRIPNFDVINEMNRQSYTQAKQITNNHAIKLESDDTAKDTVLDELLLLQHQLHDQQSHNHCQFNQLIHQIPIESTDRYHQLQLQWRNSIMDTYHILSSWQYIIQSIIHGTRDVPLPAALLAANHYKYRYLQSEFPHYYGIQRSQRDIDIVAMERPAGSAALDELVQLFDNEVREYDNYTVCSVCFTWSTNDWNPLVYCNKCNVAVHRKCYGIDISVKESDVWCCDYCGIYPDAKSHRKERRSQSPTRMTNGVQQPQHTMNNTQPMRECILCPSSGGALKRVHNSTPAQFAHMVCALWHSFTSLDMLNNMNVVIDSEKQNQYIQQQREFQINQQQLQQQQLQQQSPLQFNNNSSNINSNQSLAKLPPPEPVRCTHCVQSYGYVIRCCSMDQNRHCPRSFHPLCAWYTGMHCTVLSMSDGYTVHIHCSNHTPQTSVGMTITQQVVPQTAIYKRIQIRLVQQREIRARGRSDLRSKHRRRQQSVADQGRTGVVPVPVNNNDNINANTNSKQHTVKRDEYPIGRCAVCFNTDDEIKFYESHNQDQQKQLKNNITQQSTPTDKTNKKSSNANNHYNDTTHSSNTTTTNSTLQSTPTAAHAKSMTSTNKHASPKSPNKKQQQQQSYQQTRATIVLYPNCPPAPYRGDMIANNVLLRCDECDMEVHQQCYGVLDEDIVDVLKNIEQRKHRRLTEILNSDSYQADDDTDDDSSGWKCVPCSKSSQSTQVIQCALCPRRGGAFKQMMNGEWCHVSCAVWYAPDISFMDPIRLSGIDGIDEIQPGRRRLRCYICKRIGTCINCSDNTCSATFHPLCNQFTGSFMLQYQDSLNNSTTAVSYCKRHSPVILSRFIDYTPQLIQLTKLRYELVQTMELTKHIQTRENIKSQLFDTEFELERKRWTLVRLNKPHIKPPSTKQKVKKMKSNDAALKKFDISSSAVSNALLSPLTKGTRSHISNDIQLSLDYITHNKSNNNKAMAQSNNSKGNVKRARGRPSKASLQSPVLSVVTNSDHTTSSVESMIADTTPTTVQLTDNSVSPNDNAVDATNDNTSSVSESPPSISTTSVVQSPPSTILSPSEHVVHKSKLTKSVSPKQTKTKSMTPSQLTPQLTAPALTLQQQQQQLLYPQYNTNIPYQPTPQQIMHMQQLLATSNTASFQFSPYYIQSLQPQIQSQLSNARQYPSNDANQQFIQQHMYMNNMYMNNAVINNPFLQQYNKQHNTLPLNNTTSNMSVSPSIPTTQLSTMSSVSNVQDNIINGSPRVTDSHATISDSSRPTGNVSAEPHVVQPRESSIIGASSPSKSTDSIRPVIATGSESPLQAAADTIHSDNSNKSDTIKKKAVNNKRKYISSSSSGSDNNSDSDTIGTRTRTRRMSERSDASMNDDELQGDDSRSTVSTRSTSEKIKLADTESSKKSGQSSGKQKKVSSGDNIQSADHVVKQKKPRARTYITSQSSTPARLWDDSECDELMSMRNADVSVEEMARVLGRTVSSIENKLYKLLALGTKYRYNKPDTKSSKISDNHTHNNKSSGKYTTTVKTSSDKSAKSYRSISKQAKHPPSDSGENDSDSSASMSTRSSLRNKSATSAITAKIATDDTDQHDESSDSGSENDEARDSFNFTVNSDGLVVHEDMSVDPISINDDDRTICIVCCNTFSTKWNRSRHEDSQHDMTAVRQRIAQLRQLYPESGSDNDLTHETANNHSNQTTPSRTPRTRRITYDDESRLNEDADADDNDNTSVISATSQRSKSKRNNSNDTDDYTVGDNVNVMYDDNKLHSATIESIKPLQTVVLYKQINNKKQTENELKVYTRQREKYTGSATMHNKAYLVRFAEFGKKYDMYVTKEELIPFSQQDENGSDNG